MQPSNPPEYFFYPWQIQPIPEPPEGMDVLWRVEVRYHSVCIDAELELYGRSKPQLYIYWRPVTKRTPCGAWIGRLSKRFVNLEGNKKWAYNTKEEALQSFLKRKECQIRILKQQLADAEEAMALGQFAVERTQQK